jgi:DNA-binding response OmpR family regulator
VRSIVTEDTALLIVEDDPETLALYLRIMGFEYPGILVHGATNPEEAISLFEQYHHQVIVSDLKVPNKNDGIAIARRICHEKPDTIIFLVTADSSTIDSNLKNNIRRLCIEGILGKPVDLRLLTSRINEAFATIALPSNTDSDQIPSGAVIPKEIDQ